MRRTRCLLWVQGSVLWGQAGVSNPLGRPSNQSGAGGELFLEWCKGRRDSSLGKGHSKVQCMFIAALCVHTQGRAIQICQKVPSLTHTQRWESGPVVRMDPKMDLAWQLLVMPVATDFQLLLLPPIQQAF